MTENLQDTRRQLYWKINIKSSENFHFARFISWTTVIDELMISSCCKLYENGIAFWANRLLLASLECQAETVVNNLKVIRVFRLCANLF